MPQFLPAGEALSQQKIGKGSSTTSSLEWEGKEAARPHCLCLYFCFKFCFEIKHIITPLQTTKPACDTAYDLAETKSRGTRRNTKAKEDRLWSQQLLVLAGAGICIKAKLGKHPFDILSKLQLDSVKALFMLSSFVSVLLLLVFQIDYLLQEFWFNLTGSWSLLNMIFCGSILYQYLIMAHL